jgi:hypothetical protein
MTSGPASSPELTFEEVRERVLHALERLRFGTIELQVHDYRVVRITRTEQVRVETQREEKNRI